MGLAEDDDRVPYVEEVLDILERGAKGMSGEDFLLSACVRLFGPKALKELKEALQEKGFLPEEPVKQEMETLVKIK